LLREEHAMTSIAEHYERHLAPVYSWLMGGIDDALARGQEELAEIGLISGSGKYAVDLGAGFGMHAIPLARAGWGVLAIDMSAHLLSELREHVEARHVVTARDDLLNFPPYLTGRPDAVLCLGDTLTHLPTATAVQMLVSLVAQHLAAGGRFVVTFRDYSQALEGPERFILVKSDDSRLFTCFLEYNEDVVRVHDVLHQRTEGSWQMRVSAYQKLRLAPEWVQRELERCGFVVQLEGGFSGLVRIVAIRH
jgi:SAM-dependent methyltransferase